jgi:glycosyltransferase involved in cell wall biosynthesis
VTSKTLGAFNALPELMKVLIATHSYAGNGAAVMLLAVIEHWVKDLGWTVDALLGMDEEVPEQLVATGAAVFPTADPRNYDFALVNTIVAAPHVDVLAPQLPTVLWVHEAETAVLTSNVSPLKWRQFFELPSKLVFQTRWQTESVFRSFLPDYYHAKVACVANGLPSIPLDITPRERTPGKKRIVFAGGVYARKRPHDLIDAVVALQRDDIECVFVGTTSSLETIGPDYVAKLQQSTLFKLAGELDRRSTLAYIASADVFCLPSGDESQPIAPLEAAALGVPCLLSDLPPYAGTWRHGINCLMHPVGHSSLLRRNLLAALEDETIRKPMIESAKTLATQFSMGSFLQRFTAEMPI